MSDMHEKWLAYHYFYSIYIHMYEKWLAYHSFYSTYMIHMYIYKIFKYMHMTSWFSNLNGISRFLLTLLIQTWCGNWLVTIELKNSKLRYKCFYNFNFKVINVKYVLFYYNTFFIFMINSKINYFKYGVRDIEIGI